MHQLKIVIVCLSFSLYSVDGPSNANGREHRCGHAPREREDREDCSAFQASSYQEIPSAPEALDSRIKELTPSATSVSTTNSIWPFARALGVVRS